ncbi:hypothetical protein A946_02045 [Methylacidiphilum kamchatkense Kam1]|uniref:CRISPR-associated Cmr4 family protein n=1 Tax=Methylacidiphilum kamchatkense Kam1 TaxID=1202785 RepID=A0A0C1UT53_9BACT|nr:type III-B CRISPR module RAMP protein Cmr4 [Methylacidiphilum kamchatkense]KIE59474.1 hypothetical protein A946_02045 [Methylacidiphilum kamchatkense Kam1]QDQ42527.1 CRISPR-associated Cmr4 family protein [Methylacidiphilum kamchatkense Kam1]
MIGSYKKQKGKHVHECHNKSIFLGVFYTKNLKAGEKAMDDTAIIYFFTRTPLHIGSGGSVGAIDLPIIRERHTAFPIIPGSAIKGVFADEWVEPKVKKVNSNEEKEYIRNEEGKTLFGTGADEEAKGGVLQFSEAKLLFFPIRSPKGCFGWITCPLILNRYARDTGLNSPFDHPSLSDNQALFKKDGLLAIKEGEKDKVILEEYVFEHAGELPSNIDLLNHLRTLISKDPIWEKIEDRVVIISDGMMSFFTQSACEIAQHVKIDDKTGTAESGALFNQENVPSETAFYCIVRKSALRSLDNLEKDPFDLLQEKIIEKKIFQFGADAGTGLGYCTTVFSKLSKKGEESNEQ